MMIKPVVVSLCLALPLGALALGLAPVASLVNGVTGTVNGTVNSALTGTTGAVGSLLGNTLGNTLGGKLVPSIINTISPLAAAEAAASAADPATKLQVQDQQRHYQQQRVAAMGKCWKEGADKKLIGVELRQFLGQCVNAAR